MRTLTFALALTFAGCAHSPPEPEAAPVDQTSTPSEPVKEATVDPVVAAIEPATAVTDAGTDSSVSVKPPSNQEAVKSPAPDAGVAPKDVTVAAKPPPTRDAGVAPKAPVVAKPPAARDAGVVAAKDPVVVAAGPVAAPDKKTERLWKSKCSACHGIDGKGATEKGKKMLVSDFTAAAWQSSRTNAELRKGIVDGFKGTKNGVKQEMDPFGPELEPAQVTALLGYVRWVGAPR